MEIQKIKARLGTVKMLTRARERERERERERDEHVSVIRRC